MVITMPGHCPAGTAAFALTGMPLATGSVALDTVEDGDGSGGWGPVAVVVKGEVPVPEIAAK